MKPSMKTREEFPEHIVPPVLADLARGVAARLDTSYRIVVMAGLCATSFAMHHKFRIQTHRKQWIENTGLWVLFRIPSGGAKSAIARAMVEKPMKAIERYENDRREHYNDLLKMNIKDPPIPSGKKSTGAGWKENSRAVAKATAPTFRTHDTNPTGASFTRALGAMNEALSVYSDEARGFLSTVGGVYSKGGADDLNPFLAIWDGKSVRAPRVTDPERAMLDEPTGGILLLGQNEPIDEALGNTEFVELGFIARFLIFSEPLNVDPIPDRERPDEDEDLGKRWVQKLLEIYKNPYVETAIERRLQSGPGADPYGPEPWPRGRQVREDDQWVTLTLDPEARERMFDVVDLCDWALLGSGHLAWDPAHAKKLAAIIYRLAAVLHALWGDSGWYQQPIPLERIEEAVALAEYAIHERQVIRTAGAQEVDKDVERAIQWLQGRPEKLTRRDMQQGLCGGNSAFNRSRLDEVIEILWTKQVLLPISGDRNPRTRTHGPWGGAWTRPRSHLQAVTDG